MDEDTQHWLIGLETEIADECGYMVFLWNTMESELPRDGVECEVLG